MGRPLHQVPRLLRTGRRLCQARRRLLMGLLLPLAVHRLHQASNRLRTVLHP